MSDKLVVGLELGFFGGPRTGVVNYAAHLTRAALTQEPSLRYIGFLNSRWLEATPAFLHDLIVDNGAVVAQGHQSKVADTNGIVRRIVSRLPGARVAYRKVRRASFAASVRRQPFALFHAFNFRPPSDPGKPVLPVVYDLSAFRHPEMHPAERVRWLQPLAETIVEAPLVQTISDFSKREIVDLFGYPADRVFVAQPAAAPLFAPRGEETTARELAALKLRYGSYFLCVGTLEPRKNIRTLVAAYGRLSPAERARCPLVIAGGTGWGDLNLPSQAEALRSDGSLRFLTEMTNLHLRSLYEGARLSLMPSIYEGFGMPVVEALACGTPVAYSAGTAMEEIAAGLGHAVPAEDVEGWTEVLRDALAGDDEIGSAPRRAARVARAQEFSWQCSAGRVIDAYRRLLPV